jgi:Ca-activated chloride channel family protein
VCALGAVAFAVLVALAPVARANGIVVEAPGEGPTVSDRAARGSPVVLVSHRVSADLRDRVADVTVEQTFRNRADAVLEGVYLFPLPEGAAVHGFAMTMGGRLVEGEVIAARDARRVYESIVRRRRDPGLLEYAGRGLYRASVFPIEARGEVRVRLSFQQVLPEDGGTLELRYPLATDRMNGEPVEEVSIEARVESDADLKAVYSPSHAVEVTRDGERKARVAWSRRGAVADRDFLLYLGRSPEAVGFTLASHQPAGEEGTFLAVLAPRVAPSEGERLPKDVVFVLDTSGSMEGPKIVQARRAVATGIGLLRAGDRFNVITFSGGVVPFRDGLLPADAENRLAARTWLEQRPAVGGTNIEEALLTALSTRSDGRLLLVVFVTDGLPSVGERDPDKIVARALASNASRARVFTFGVGSDLDVRLLDRVAEATGGTRDYVAGGDDLEIATGRFYAKVVNPILSDVHVDLGPGVFDVYPRRVPDLFAGGQVVLFGRYRAGGPRKIRLTGTVSGRPVSFEHEGVLRADAGAAFLPRLWAQRKVAFLLDDMRLHGESAEVVQEVERLATRFGIVTPYTAGLVVEEAELEGRFATDDPLAQIGGTRGGQYRGPGGVVPPGLRGPTDPAPAPPAPPSPSDPTPPTSPPPATSPSAAPRAGLPAWAEPSRSKDLRRRKDASAAEDTDPANGAVRTVGSRTFVRRPDGRICDTAWDGKAETTKVPAWSDAYFALLEKGDEVARILAIGDRVVFLLEGKAYEVVPAEAPGSPGR